MQETPGSTPGPGRSPGERNGNPLQYSCLRNPMDRGAWWATVHGITKDSDTTWQLEQQQQWLIATVFSFGGKHRQDLHLLANFVNLHTHYTYYTHYTYFSHFRFPRHCDQEQLTDMVPLEAKCSSAQSWTSPVSIVWEVTELLDSHHSLACHCLWVVQNVNFTSEFIRSGKWIIKRDSKIQMDLH